MAKNGLRAAGYGAPGGPVFSASLVEAFRRSDTWIDGAFALEQCFILSAMILAAATTHVIERQFVRAAVWCGAGAALSALGLMHSYRWTPADTAVSLTPAWPWAAGYLGMGACFLAARAITEEAEGH